MLKPTGLDRSAVRAAFERRLAAPERADFLLREVERRLLERLEPIRVEPLARVLDLGCGHGGAFGPLALRYPGADLIGGDIAVTALMASAGAPGQSERLRDGARKLLSKLGIGGEESPPAIQPLRVGFDAHQLPIAADSIDLLWSNLAVHWLDDPLAALAEWQRVVRPGGVVIFSAFGVESLVEARGATVSPQPDGSRPPSCWPAFQDMHDWGDALVAAGFTQPVLETEKLTLTYTTADRYREDVESIAMLSGQELDTFRERPPAPRLTLELIYGHAWCPENKRRADGLATVTFHRNRS